MGFTILILSSLLASLPPTHWQMSLVRHVLSSSQNELFRHSHKPQRHSMVLLWCSSSQRSFLLPLTSLNKKVESWDRWGGTWPSHSGDWGREITWAQELKASLSIITPQKKKERNLNQNFRLVSCVILHKHQVKFPPQGLSLRAPILENKVSIWIALGMSMGNWKGEKIMCVYVCVKLNLKSKTLRREESTWWGGGRGRWACCRVSLKINNLLSLGHHSQSSWWVSLVQEWASIAGCV